MTPNWRHFCEMILLILFSLFIVGLIVLGAWYEWRKFWFFVSY